MPVTLASSALSLESQNAAWDEAIDPGSIVLKLAANTSSSLVASVVIRPLQKDFDSNGQQTVIEPCVVDVRKALLPNWATLESLPTNGKLVTSGKTYKIQSAQDTGFALRLVCFRWPNDDD